MDRLVRSSTRIVLVSTLLGCACFASQSSRTPVTSDQLKSNYQRDERAFLMNQDNTLEAQHIRQALTRKAQETHQELQALAERGTSFSHRMDTLLDSDVGKRIARYHVGPLTYVHFMDFPPVSVPEVTAKLDTASSLLNRLRMIPDESDVGFLPSDKAQQELQDLHAWANTRKTALEAAEASLNTLIRRAPTDIDLSQSVTLRVAIEEYRSTWSQLVVESILASQDVAGQDVNDTIMEGAYHAQIERAAFERDTILAQMRAEIDRLRNEFQIALLDQKRANEKALTEANERYKDTLAELNRLRQRGETDRTVADVYDRIGQDAKLNAARKEQLKALARSPEVQSLLAPFLTWGYHQPGQAVPAYEKGPVSLTRLQVVHALRPSPEGLRALLTAGTAVRDKERPRWPFAKNLQHLKPSELDQLRQAQQYLIDLGETMVEMGMLAP